MKPGSSEGCIPREPGGKVSRLKILLVSLGVSAAIFFFVIYILRNSEDFSRLIGSCFSNIEYVAAAAGIFIGLTGLNGYLFNYLTGVFKVRLTVNEWFGLATVTGFYNLVTPFRGGMAVRALYLKKKYGFPYSRFVSIQAASQAVSYFTAGVTGVAGLLLMEASGAAAKTAVLLLLLAATIFFGLLLLVSPRMENRNGKWRQRLAAAVDGWNLLRAKKEAVFFMMCFFVALRILKAAFIFIVFKCFGITVGFWAALFISSMGMFALIITILPGNLGLDEAVAVFSAGLAGIGLQEAVACVLLARFISLAVLMSLGPLFSYLLLKKRHIC